MKTVKVLGFNSFFTLCFYVQQAFRCSRQLKIMFGWHGIHRIIHGRTQRLSTQRYLSFVFLSSWNLFTNLLAWLCRAPLKDMLFLPQICSVSKIKPSIRRERVTNSVEFSFSRKPSCRNKKHCKEIYHHKNSEKCRNNQSACLRATTVWRGYLTLCVTDRAECSASRHAISAWRIKDGKSEYQKEISRRNQHCLAMIYININIYISALSITMQSLWQQKQFLYSHYGCHESWLQQ